MLATAGGKLPVEQLLLEEQRCQDLLQAWMNARSIEPARLPQAVVWANILRRSGRTRSRTCGNRTKKGIANTAIPQDGPQKELFRLESRLSTVTCSDAEHILHGGDKNFAISDFTSLSSCTDRRDCGIQLFV